MNEFESDWISLSQSFLQNGWIQDDTFQDGCHHQINQIELIWVRVRLEWECFWVNLRKDNKVSESKMEELKMAVIIKLSENEWVWVRLNEFESGFVQNGWIQDGTFQDGYHHQINQIELIWVRVRLEWECFWVNLRKDNKVSEYKMAVSESNMAEFKMAVMFKLSENEWVKYFLCK